MKIGIISDSHDHVEHIQKTVELLKERKVDLVIHAGDFVAPFTMQYYKGLKMIGVFGNNDGDKYMMTMLGKKAGVEMKGEFYEDKIDGLKIAVYHGTVFELRDSLIESGKYDVVVYGHDHKLRVKKIGETLAINPGTVHGVSGVENRATFAILETETKDVEIIDL